MANTATLSSINAELAISVANLFPQAQIIYGFSADEAFSFEDTNNAEVVMGVDGILSAGFVPKAVTMSLTLQADSPSISFFETWRSTQIQYQDLFLGSGTVTYPGLGTQYNLIRGWLDTNSPAPSARKILQPRKFTIVWNYVQPSGYIGG